LDFPAYVRVLFGLITLNPQGGGSTITQQLAKNLYTMNPEHSLDGWLGTWVIPQKGNSKNKRVDHFGKP
jgi:penicillin-binding protein 1A